MFTSVILLQSMTVVSKLENDIKEHIRMKNISQAAKRYMAIWL